MKLEERMRVAIQRTAGNVILRADVAALGGRSQVSVALAELQKKGVVVRLGIGVYAKTVKDPDTGLITPVEELETLAVEALQRLGISASVLQSSAGQSDLVVPKEVRIGLQGNRRIRRKLSLGARSVVYVNERAPSPKSENTVKRHPKTGDLIIPTIGLGRYVRDLAKLSEVSYVKTYADEWAEDVSRLAGDEIHTDSIEQLVIALKKQKKVTGREAVHLLTNYLRERQRV
jgi:hypothetical protein